MAAPVPEDRLDPQGFQVLNGRKTTITLESDPSIEIWEISVGLPTMTAGDPIDISTQHNDRYTTKFMDDLIDMEPFDVVAGYAASTLNAIKTQLGVNQEITITMRDGSQWVFYGAMQSAAFDPHVRGTMPTATFTFVPTNYDPVNCVEAGPVLVDEGTCLSA